MKVTEVIVEQVIIRSVIVDYVNNTYVYVYVCGDTIGSFIHEYLVNLCHRLDLESSCYFNTLNTNDFIEIEVC